MQNSVDQRCDCGKLLFRKSTRGLEFKCHRCKRIHLIPMDRLDAKYHHLCPIIDISNEFTQESSKVEIEARDRESNAQKKRGG